MTGNDGRISIPRATSDTRSSPIAIACGCNCSRYASHCPSVDGADVATAKRGIRAPASGCCGQLEQQRDEAGELVAHFTAIDDQVDRAVLKQKFRALKSFGQRLAH